MPTSYRVTLALVATSCLFQIALSQAEGGIGDGCAASTDCAGDDQCCCIFEFDITFNDTIFNVEEKLCTDNCTGAFQEANFRDIAPFPIPNLGVGITTYNEPRCSEDPKQLYGVCSASEECSECCCSLSFDWILTDETRIPWELRQTCFNRTSCIQPDWERDIAEANRVEAEYGSDIVVQCIEIYEAPRCLGDAPAADPTAGLGVFCLGDSKANGASGGIASTNVRSVVLAVLATTVGTLASLSF